MLRMNGDAVVLCGKGKCCPEVKKIDENTFEVTDDDGNTIRVTKAQLQLIPDAVKILGGEQLICG
jgi:preprotein translocase subunit YajC